MSGESKKAKKTFRLRTSATDSALLTPLEFEPPVRKADVTIHGAENFHKLYCWMTCHWEKR